MVVVFGAYYLHSKDNFLIAVEIIDIFSISSTQRLETTTTHFKSAYGKNNPYAIFNFGTKKSCKSIINVINIKANRNNVKLYRIS